MHVAYCQDVVDVVNVIRWAREHDVPLPAPSRSEGYASAYLGAECPAA
jgi:hypothetical protein